MPGNVTPLFYQGFIMNTSRFITVATLAALSAVASVAVHADEADGSQYGVNFNSTRTRAEVRAEAVAAVGDRSQELAALGSTAVQSKATRATVRAEAVQAQRLGQIPAGEASSM
jgi:hypothetical protein